MPLYGREVVQLVKPLTDISPGETIYTIPHTQEQFRSKDEYEKRLEYYKVAKWTCQCTGHINMTHEEATRSEKENYDLLERKFPAYFEKAVLEVVHHSTEILDNLVDHSWSKLQQGFAVGEPVSLRIKAQGRTIEGTITKVDTSAVDEKPMVNGESTSSNCSSPSSDKENHSSKVNGGAIGSDGDSPKKFTGSKLLPYKYSMKLKDENEKFEKEMKVIDDMILRLMRHRHSWPFHEPVDAEEVPDYYEIVKIPMDLQTMRQKIKEKRYSSAQDFIDDAALMFDNAELYNKPDSDVGKCVEPFEKYFRDNKNRCMKDCRYRRDFGNPKIFKDTTDESTEMDSD